MNTLKIFSLSCILLFAGLTTGVAQQTSDDTSSIFDSNPARGNTEARPSPNAAVGQTIGTTEVAITYGRPGMKGRSIFGDLIPYGSVWRAGANEATSITFSDDVEIMGQSLSAGTYSLYAIPGEDEWTIIFNTKQSWGTRYDESQDELRVTVSPQEGPSMEWFLIYFENLANDSAHMVLHWSTTKVPVKISAH